MRYKNILIVSGITLMIIILSFTGGFYYSVNRFLNKEIKYTERIILSQDSIVYLTNEVDSLHEALNDNFLNRSRVSYKNKIIYINKISDEKQKDYLRMDINGRDSVFKHNVIKGTEYYDSISKSRGFTNKN